MVIDSEVERIEAIEAIASICIAFLAYSRKHGIDAGAGIINALIEANKDVEKEKIKSLN